MTRWAITADRVVAFLVGGVLIAVGAGALLWHTGLIPGFPQAVTAPALVEALSTWWWRWAVAAAGLASTGVALRWLAAHRPAGKAAPIELHDSDATGTVSIDPSAIASAAADALRQHPAVRSAKGRAVTDRGERTIELAVTAAHPSDLDAVVEAIDVTCADIAAATSGAPPLAARATLHLKGGRALTRRQLE
ncbi:MAG: hypothetical protein QOC58_955 [Mycobacterium sp.]|jgi:hypothetical protein|nr:hypothetical protein [Mycobacterium sp.]